MAPAREAVVQRAQRAERPEQQAERSDRLIQAATAQTAAAPLATAAVAVAARGALVVEAEARVPTYLVVVVAVGQALSLELLQVPSNCQYRQALPQPLQTLAILIIWLLPA